MMKRRKFIQSSSLVTLPFMLRGVELNAISKSTLTSAINPDTDKVLVLVQLNGGNDGLNTLVPLDQFDQLMSVRSNIMMPEASLLHITDKNALNGSMTGFKELYDEGQLSVIQSVAYPNQNRSHFRSTDIWNTASDSDDYISTGWLGRHFQLQHPSFPEGYPNEDYPDPFAITLGTVVSETCQGASGSFSFATRDENSLKQLVTTEPGQSDDSCYGRELQYVQRVVAQSNAYSSVVLDAFEKATNAIDYPDNNLAEQLKIVANLIAGGLRTKVYVVSLGGFDTHANQVIDGDVINGEHPELLSILSSSIKAFQKDINSLGLGNRVVGMTFSEFGRRIRSNDGFGTDHGTAAPLFVFGQCVNGGVFGENPEIDTQVDVQEGVPMQYDFRSIYASMLIDWFEVDESDVKTILFEDFQYIPFLRECSIASNTNEESGLDRLSLQIIPNPSTDNVRIAFTGYNEIMKLEIFNALGSRVETCFSRTVGNGLHDYNVAVSEYPPGTYIARLSNRSNSVTKRFVKI